MLKFIFGIFDSRFWALILKEVRQIFKSKQLIFLLLFPPTVQLLIFGLALNPNVDGIGLGVVDQANTRESRDLIATLVANEVFILKTAPPNQQTLQQQVRTGKITAGLVIPPDFSRNLIRGGPAQIQVLLDGVDANTAGIAGGYLGQIVNDYSQRLPCPQAVCVPMAQVQPQTRFLYNPGLRSSWFFVPGVIGVVLTLTGSLVSSVTLIREKDVGTLEQLLMTPATGWEILLAKIVPLFGLLMGDILLASSLGWLVFQLPFRGNFGVFLALSALYVVVSIGLGMLLATLARTQQQVILSSFFFNVPIIQLSGAIAPTESMPPLFQLLSWIDPLHHYVVIARSLILKGVGLSVVWPHALALAGFAIGLLTISGWRFRSQLN
jgi:ABC-2 type transport system permease protein